MSISRMAISPSIGKTNSTMGVGIVGESASASGYGGGMVGLTYSPNGFGVRGYADVAGGQPYGVVGSTLSSLGAGGYFTNWSSRPGLVANVQGGGNIIEAYVNNLSERRFYVTSTGNVRADGNFY